MGSPTMGAPGGLGATPSPAAAGMKPGSSSAGGAGSPTPSGTGTHPTTSGGTGAPKTYAGSGNQFWGTPGGGAAGGQKPTTATAQNLLQNQIRSAGRADLTGTNTFAQPGGGTYPQNLQSLSGMLFGG